MDHTFRRMDSLMDEWNELDLEFGKLQEWHSDYLKRVEEMRVLQTKCNSVIKTQRYGLKQMSMSLKDNLRARTEDEEKEYQELQNKIKERKMQFRKMEEVLPHSNGLYLDIIVGKVNISLLSRVDRLNYKQEYETFKLVLNIIIFLLTVIFYFIRIERRVFDAALQFLLVWFYCTLTIRESILYSNGSKIKFWWRLHHFISTVAAGIFLLWPDGETYWLFRNQSLLFISYISIIQLVQFYYQTGVLYRLRSLGVKKDMDVTIAGFTHFMFKGFSFLLPFLFTGYAFQVYNGYTLLTINNKEGQVEWQVPALGFIFLLLAFGNLWTTLGVVKQRFATKFNDYFTKNKYRLEVIKMKRV